MTFSRSSTAAVWAQRLFMLLLLWCLVGFLWYPRGFNIPPTEDDWLLYSSLDQRALANTQGLLFVAAGRPLSGFWWQVAYAITPNSMLAASWFTALMLVVRGVSFYVIVYHLTRRRAWAAAAACLMLVLPLDFAVYEKGTFHIQITTSLYFMATALFLTHARRMRPVHLILIGFMLALACSMYESTYALIAVTPLLLVLQERRLTRRIVLLSLAWWAVPAVCALVFFIPSLTAETSYQHGILKSAISPLSLLRTTFDAYVHVFARSWYAALRTEPGDFLLLRCLFGAIVAVAVWILSQREKLAVPRIPLWLLFPISIVLIGAGFAMYLPTPLLSGGSGNRVHFLTTGGASLAFVWLSWMIGRVLRVSFVFPILIGVLITIGLGGTMNFIRAGTLRTVTAQGDLLSSLTTQAPHLQPDTTLVFLFSPEANNPFPDFYVAYLQGAVMYLYRDYGLHIVMCYQDTCSADVWQTIDSAEAIVFRVKPSLELEMLTDVPELGPSYDPQSRFDAAAAKPVRWQTLYSQRAD